MCAKLWKCNGIWKLKECTNVPQALFVYSLVFFNVKFKVVASINSMFKSDVNIVRAAINSCKVYHEVHCIVRVPASK